MKVEQFIRKLNNTELNNQNTNDAYVRISKDIQEEVPSDFFDELDSRMIKVINKKTKSNVDNWVRYQHYQSNNEYRVANLSSIYKSYRASSGDFVYIEKIQLDSSTHYEIYMKTYPKVCLKYSKSNKAFEILNEAEVLQMGILDLDIVLNFEGQEIKSEIKFALSKKKRNDSPTESRFYTIEHMPTSLYQKIQRDSFVEVVKRKERFFINVENSWSFNKFTK
ncbi:hypothetical protein OAD66_02620 [Bacteroidia bacterium]|nr:hypothetical protein [Bacteroidia bacterium]